MNMKKVKVTKHETINELYATALLNSLWGKDATNSIQPIGSYYYAQTKPPVPAVGRAAREGQPVPEGGQACRGDPALHARPGHGPGQLAALRQQVPGLPQDGPVLPGLRGCPAGHPPQPQLAQGGRLLPFASTVLRVNTGLLTFLVGREFLETTPIPCCRSRKAGQPPLLPRLQHWLAKLERVETFAGRACPAFLDLQQGVQHGAFKWVFGIDSLLAKLSHDIMA